MGGAIGTLAFRLVLLFSVIGCGFFAYKAKIIGDTTSKEMTNYLNRIAIPIYLITSVGTEPISGGSKWLVYCGIIMALYYIIGFGGVYLFCFLTKKDRAKRAVYTCMSVIPNCAFVGLPMVRLLVGEQAVPYIGIMMTAFNIVFFTVGMQMFNKDGKFSFKSLITPMNGATVIMLVLLLTNMQLNTYVYTFLSQITAIVSPMCLMIIGINIAKTPVLDALKRPIVWILSALKLLIFPALVQLVLWLSGISFPLDMRMALLIGIACPGSTMACVIANQNDMEPELASQSVAHSTLFSIVTMPLLIVAIGKMLGMY